MQLPSALGEVISTPTLAVLGGAVAVTTLYAALSAPPPTKLADDGKTVAKLPRRLPSTSLLLGELPQYLANSERVHEWMAEKCQEVNGEIWCMVIPGQSNLVLVSDPHVVEEVMHTKFDIFQRGSMQSQLLEPLFGNSLINSDGGRWYHQRKAAAKFFTAKSLRLFMTTVMDKNMKQVNAAIDRSIAERKTIELDGLFHAFSMQTFTEVGLGVDVKWIGLEERSPLEELIVVASNATLRRFRTPAFVWKLERALNVGTERKLADGMEEVRVWIRSVIKESLVEIAKRRETTDSQDVKSVIELFVEHSGDGVEGMGPDDLVDFILTFVLAAHDTSAVTLSWFFLAVMKNPHVAAKIREEMAQVLPSLGVTDTDTYITTDHVHKLVYLEATIKEVLRLWPAAPMVQRECLKDEIIGGDTFIPKGYQVAFSSYAMARLPQIWGPDAQEFKPERWIDQSTGELIPVPSNKLSSFGTGPRICIGMKLAMVELRVVTANLMHRYDFELAAPNSGKYMPALSLMLKDPVLVHPTRRGGADEAKVGK